MEMTAKQRLERAMYQLSTHKHYQFFGASLMSGDVHIDTRVSTGATDGLNCYYNPEFILSSDRARVAVLIDTRGVSQDVQTRIRVGELEKARPHAYQHGM
jgi:hypothetical protein